MTDVLGRGAESHLKAFEMMHNFYYCVSLLRCRLVKEPKQGVAGNGDAAA